MKFEFHNIGESKSALRKELAARPIAEKLRMLDALRERTLSIRRASKLIRGGDATDMDGQAERPH